MLDTAIHTCHHTCYSTEYNWIIQRVIHTGRKDFRSLYLSAPPHEELRIKTYSREFLIRNHTYKDSIVQISQRQSELMSCTTRATQWESEHWEATRLLLLEWWIASGVQTYRNQVWKDFYGFIGGDSAKDGKTAWLKKGKRLGDWQKRSQRVRRNQAYYKDIKTCRVGPKKNIEQGLMIAK